MSQPDHISDGKRADLWVCILLLVAVAAVFWPVGHYEFVNFDDPNYVSKNTHVQAGLTVANIAWSLKTTYFENWHPLTWLSYMLDCQLFGLNAGAHHLVNLLFHELNTLLVYAVFRRLTRVRWRSALVAALFGLHPLHVESVAWISERKDVLSMLFCLLSLGAYALYVERPRRTRYVLALAFFTLGLMAKPMLVTLPFLLLVLDFWPLRRFTTEGRESGGDSAPRETDGSELPTRKTRAPLQTAPARRVGARGLQARAYGPVGRAPSRGVLGCEIFGLKSRLRIVAADVRRRIMGATSREGPPPHVGGYEPKVLPSHALCLVVEKLPFFAASIASCVVTYRSQQAGAAVAAVAALPLGDRLANAIVSYARYIVKMIWPEGLAVFYPYPSSWAAWQIGGALMMLVGLTAVAVRLWRRHPYLVTGWLWFVGTLVPVIGIVQVGSQSMADRYTYFPLLGLFLALVWGGAELAEKWKMPMVVRGLSGGTIMVLCAVLSARQVQFWKNSVTLFEHALAVTQGNDVAHNNLGVALADQGKPDEALVHFNAALAIDPMNYWAHGYIGTILLGRGKLDEAVTHFREALHLQPDNPDARCGLGLALARQGKSAESLEYLKEASRLNPLNAEVHFHLAAAYEGSKRPGDARSEYEEALRLKPDSVLALNNLAWLEATHEDAAIRNGAAAVTHAERACELTRHQEAIFMGTLAAAYAEAGRFPEAVSVATKAAALATANRQSDIAARNRDLLELYRAGKPARSPSR